MSFDVINYVPGAPIAQNGTFTVAPPNGDTVGQYIGGVRHKIVANQALYEAPNDFTVALTSEFVVTITWLKATALPAGKVVRVQLDKPGASAEVDFASVAGGLAVPSRVLNSVEAKLRYIDLGAPVALSAAGLVASASGVAATPMTLIAAGAIFDVPRNVTITSAGDDSAKTFAVTGLDAYGAVMRETITGANGLASGKKAFKSITSIVPSANTASTVTAGWGNVLGLPVWLPAPGNILAEYQDLVVPANAATKTAGLSPLTTPTATTADVRGTYLPNSNAANLCNGARTYGLLVALFDADHIGSPQF